MKFETKITARLLKRFKTTIILFLHRLTSKHPVNPAMIATIFIFFHDEPSVNPCGKLLLTFAEFLTDPAAVFESRDQPRTAIGSFRKSE